MGSHDTLQFSCRLVQFRSLHRLRHGQRSARHAFTPGVAVSCFHASVLVALLKVKVRQSQPLDLDWVQFMCSVLPGRALRCLYPAMHMPRRFHVVGFAAAAYLVLFSIAITRVAGSDGHPESKRGVKMGPEPGLIAIVEKSGSRIDHTIQHVRPTLSHDPSTKVRHQNHPTRGNYN